MNHVLCAGWTRFDDVEEDRSPCEWGITLSDPDSYEYLQIWVTEETAEFSENALTRPLFRQVDEWSTVSGDDAITKNCEVDPGLPYIEYLEGVCDLFRETATMDVNSLMPGTPRRPLLTKSDRKMVGFLLHFAVDARCSC